MEAMEEETEVKNENVKEEVLDEEDPLCISGKYFLLFKHCLNERFINNY